MNNSYPVIFTDLDGTLLDHDTYSTEPARPTLKKLLKAGIPVIPTTSKTYAELLAIRQQLDLSGPFIIENGAAIHIPHGFLPQKPADTQWQDAHWVHQFTFQRSYWLKLLEQEEEQFQGQFTHFAAMSVAQVCEATGLTAEQAKLAMQRQYGEPVMWLGKDRQRKDDFIKRLVTRGATPLQGGRFLHISGECDKGVALNWFMQELQRQHPGKSFFSIALGDSQNDVAMLNAADIAVRIQSPSHQVPNLNKKDNVFTSTLPGPSGWSEVLNTILSDYLQEA